MSGQDGTGGMVVLWFLYALVIILMIASLWKVFAKAGKPGWGSLIPIYNIYLMIKIAGKPGWWLILMFIPIINIVVEILVYIGISQNFGKGGGFVVGLIFLPFIFFPILAFGSARYQLQPSAQV
jgi:ABC-type sulfate transport system permease subunit